MEAKKDSFSLITEEVYQDQLALVKKTFENAYFKRTYTLEDSYIINSSRQENFNYFIVHQKTKSCGVIYYMAAYSILGLEHLYQNSNVIDVQLYTVADVKDKFRAYLTHLISKI